MSSNLHQMQLSYDQVQDRLVLALLTQDFSEYRFWITRRAVKGLWNILTQLLQADQKNQLEQQRVSRQIAEQIQQEKTQHRPAANKYGTRITRRPLGDEPLLLAKIMARPSEQSRCFLHFEDIKGQSIEFSGDITIVMALCQLILQAIKQAEWDLAL